MAAIQNVDTGEIITVVNTPVLVQGVWECGNKRFTDPGGHQYVAVSTLSDTPSVPEFWELFTVQEETAIRASFDPVVVTWLRRLDDPRTLMVNLTMPSVVSAITYVAGVIPLDDGRLAQILAGVQQ